MPTTIIKGEVALRTKLSKSKDDYRVIAHSGYGLGIEDFDTIFKKFSVGTLSCNTDELSRRPPWFSCGIFNNNYIVAIRHDCTKNVDAYGRLISAACCICVPVNDFLSTQTTLTSIVNQIPLLSFFKQYKKDTFPVSVEINYEKNISDYCLAVEEMGFEFAASVAALLRTTPVAIIGGSELTAAKRLCYLDAILALLPFGTRASLSLSTWAESDVNHSIRLCFTNAKRQEQARVSWRQPNSEILKTNLISNNYYLQLKKLKTSYGVPYILRQLSEQKTPLDFRNHEQFKSVLSIINRPDEILQLLSSGKGDTSDLRDFLRKFTRQELQQEILGVSSQQLKGFLTALLQQTNVSDIDILATHWRDDIWEEAKRQLESAFRNWSSPSQSTILSFVFELSRRVDKLQELIDALIENSISLLNQRQRLHDEVIQFLIQNHDILKTHNWSTIGSNLQFLCKCIEQAIIRYSSVPETLQNILNKFVKIDPRAEKCLSAFRICLGYNAGDIDETFIDQLAKVDSYYVKLLMASAKTKIKQKVTQSVINWLVRFLSASSVESWSEWDDTIEFAATPDDISPELQAQIDVLRLGSKTADQALFLINVLNNDEAGKSEAYSNELTSTLNMFPKRKVEFIKTIIRRANEISHSNQTYLQNTAFLFLKLWSASSEIPSIKYSFEVIASLCARNFYKDAISQLLMQFEKLYPFMEIKANLEKSLSTKKPLANAAIICADAMYAKYAANEAMIAICQVFDITLQMLYTKEHINTLSNLEEFIGEIRLRLNKLMSQNDSIKIEKSCIDYLFSVDKLYFYNFLYTT